MDPGYVLWESGFACLLGAWLTSGTVDFQGRGRLTTLVRVHPEPVEEPMGRKETQWATIT